MALPRLNDTPQYELVIPSSGDTVSYRPFLVKEQKVLLMASEAQDIKQVVSSILTCIEGCVSDIDVKKLSTFDVDYIFTQIRSKSVGETATIMSPCSECEHKNEVKIELDKISVDVKNLPKNVIKLNSEISVRMKYPTYLEMLNNNSIMKQESGTEVLFAAIAACIESVMTEEENIPLSDESREEVDAFLNSLSAEQFELITTFVNSIPKIKYEAEYQCESCQHQNKLTLEGIQDFFS